MIVQLIYLEKYDWLIKVFYNTTPEDSEVILKELDDIDCEPDAFYKAAEILESGRYNTGCTYTDVEKHVTFVIINETESAKEFLNTLAHEVTHIAMHLGEFYKIDYRSEEISYLVGDIIYEMYDTAKDFLCEHCRQINFYNYGKMKIKMKKGS